MRLFLVMNGTIGNFGDHLSAPFTLYKELKLGRHGEGIELPQKGDLIEKINERTWFEVVRRYFIYIEGQQCVFLSHSNLMGPIWFSNDTFEALIEQKEWKVADSLDNVIEIIHESASNDVDEHELEIRIPDAQQRTPTDIADRLMASIAEKHRK